MVQNPMAMQRGLMAVRGQAEAWIVSYKAHPEAHGLGFTADDLAAEYPEQGFAADDPSLAIPPGGMALVAYAVAARAIGWSTDRAFIERVLGALGHTGAEWDASVDEWTRRVTSDIVIAYLYGQLFSQVGELPRR